MIKHHSIIVVCLALSALAFTGLCRAEAVSSPADATPTADPIEGISSIYSDMDMRVRLAAKPNAQACSGDACLSYQEFDTRVQLIGERLAQSAYLIYPELKKKVPNFAFSVADKQAMGSASNASGDIVIFRGVQYLDLGDEALAFIVGREIGHVVAGHHKNNAKTKLLISALAAVLFPAVGILSASSAATQATTASTSLITSAASTATSIVGSEVAMARMKPGQLTEADDIAIDTLKQAGVDAQAVAQSLDFIVERENASGWEKDLSQSTQYVHLLAGEPKDDVAELEPLPEEYAADEATMASAQEETTDLGQEEDIALAEAKQALTAEPIVPPKAILITNQTLAENRQPVATTHTALPVYQQPISDVHGKKVSAQTSKNKPVLTSTANKKLKSGKPASKVAIRGKNSKQPLAKTSAKVAANKTKAIQPKPLPKASQKPAQSQVKPRDI